MHRVSIVRIVLRRTSSSTASSSEAKRLPVGKRLFFMITSTSLGFGFGLGLGLGLGFGFGLG